MCYFDNFDNKFEINIKINFKNRKNIGIYFYLHIDNDLNFI
jgi:hypothetical protein